MYDIIGDIHGCASELQRLLELMGYKLQHGVFRHDERKAVFVGDLIDRGPNIRVTLDIVRRMVESDSAHVVMGNHEFNALAFHTMAAHRETGYLRPHSQKNVKQHQATMDQLSQTELSESLDWFRTMPMWLELDTIRVVHACWCPSSIQVIEASLREHAGFTDAFLEEATDTAARTPLFVSVDRVLKGPEIGLPEGTSYEDKDGTRRVKARTRWFDVPPETDIADYLMPQLDMSLGELPIGYQPSVEVYGASEPPVFFGHYWLSGEPAPQTGNCSCVDYSVAKGGTLVAYRWSGESRLRKQNFLSVTSSQL